MCWFNLESLAHFGDFYMSIWMLMNMSVSLSLECEWSTKLQTHGEVLRLMQAMIYDVRIVQGLQIVVYGYMRIWSLVVESLTCFLFMTLEL